MLRNFGISLLLMGLMAAAYDGFRVRDRVRHEPSNSSAVTSEDGLVHSAEVIAIPPR
jgi:hypothetical protein